MDPCLASNLLHVRSINSLVMCSLSRGRAWVVPLLSAEECDATIVAGEAFGVIPALLASGAVGATCVWRDELGRGVRQEWSDSQGATRRERPLGQQKEIY